MAHNYYGITGKLMKTSLSADVLSIQGRKKITYYKLINLYRRLWDTDHYEYEVTPVDITKYVKNKPSIISTLDTEGLNIWRSPNISLEVDNKEGKFYENESGLFTSGYIRYKSIVEINLGYVLDDGTKEAVVLFTGFIDDTNIALDLPSEHMVIPLIGKDILLDEANAEDVCQTATAENLGTGDDVAVEFTTSNNGVGSITNVYLDDKKMEEFIDYTISDTNEKSLPGKITFTFAPASGQVVKSDYDYWYSAVNINTLFEALLDEAGFDAANRVIESNIYAMAKTYVNWNSQVEFEAMSTVSRNLDTTTEPGKVLHKLEDFAVDVELNQNVLVEGVYPAQTARPDMSIGASQKYDGNAIPAEDTDPWTRVEDPAPPETIESDSGGIYTIYGAYDGETTYYKTLKTNTFACKFKLTVPFVFQSAGDDILKINMSNGSRSLNINVYIFTTGGIKYWGIKRDGESTPDWTGLAGQMTWLAYHVLWITFSDTGEYTLWFDGIKYKEASGAGSVSIDNKVQFTFCTEGDGDPMYDRTMDMDYLYSTPAVIYGTENINIGILTFKSIDTGASGKYENFGQITVKLDGGEAPLYCMVYCRSSADDVTWGDWWSTDISSSGGVSSVISVGNNPSLRYLQFKIELTTQGSPTKYMTEVTFPGFLYSQEIDVTETSKSATFSIIRYNLGGDVQIFYNTSATSGVYAYASETEIDTDYKVLTLSRYTEIRTVIYRTECEGASPEIYREFLKYAERNISTIELADFTGMTVRTAVEQLALITNCEVGVNSDGKYFVRSRNTSEVIDMELSDETNINGVDNINSGVDYIKNNIDITIGASRTVINSTSEQESRPHSIDKYGIKSYTIDSLQLIDQESNDFSYGIAQLYYDSNHDAKKQMRVCVQMLPQLELGDTVNVNFLIEPFVAYWGMPLHLGWWGKKGLHWSDTVGENEYVDLKATIIGMEISLSDMKMYLRVKEL